MEQIRQNTRNTQVISKPIIKLKNIELVNFSVIFVALAVALPWIAHQFNLAGPTFLPMHLFVLAAGLLFGWRAGLIVGLLTPLVSFSTSGMPPALILPQITFEIMIYGLAAGLFREKLKLNLCLSLILAMIVGRIGLFFAIWILATNPAGPLTGLWKAASIGWPGVVIQLAMIPIVVIWLKKYLNKHRKFED